MGDGTSAGEAGVAGATVAREPARERIDRLFRECVATAIRNGHGRNAQEALVCVAFHYVLKHREEVRRLVEKGGPGMRFKDLRCQLPGCGRSAEHLHRVRWSRRGDRHTRQELRALCAPHHEQGLREGHLRVSSGGPEELVFVLEEELLLRSPPRPAGGAAR